MVGTLSTTPVARIRRVDVFAYMLVVIGVVFATGMIGVDESLIARAGAAVGGLFVIAGALYVRYNPENVRRGTDPAPVYFYLLAAVQTLAFAGSAVIEFRLL
jgi:hypothetical protein